MEEESSKIKKIVSQDKNIRLDSYLAKQFTDYSRNYFKKLIKDKRVKIEGVVPKINYLIKEGETIEVDFLVIDEKEVKSQNIPLNILYEDKHVIAVNKPAGMVVHPAFGHEEGTLVNALLYYAENIVNKKGEESLSWEEFFSFQNDRPGIIHRLDKDTSGVILVAKTKESYFYLVDQFRERRIKKTYLALVSGVVKEKEGEIIAPLGRALYDRKKIIVGAPINKEAITYFKVLENFSYCTLLEVEPKTGRTHQIRVHLDYIGHPVIGDIKYCTKKSVLGEKVNRQLLHASEIGFVHHLTKKFISIKAPIAEDFEKILISLREKKLKSIR